MNDSLKSYVPYACAFSTILSFVAIFMSIEAKDCSDRAMALAEEAVETTDDLADVTYYSLSSILRGGQADESGINAVGDRHADNIDELEDLKDDC